MPILVVIRKHSMDTTFRFPVTYSLVSSKAIEDELIPLYNLPRTSKVLFIHQGINDTYLISTSDAKYVNQVKIKTYVFITQKGYGVGCICTG